MQRIAWALPWMAAAALAFAPGTASAQEPQPEVTHKDTPAEVSGVDISQVVNAMGMADQTAMLGVADSLPAAWCGTERTSDDTTNQTYAAADPQVKVIYAYPADRADRFGSWKDDLQADASLIDTFVSSQAGSTKAPRFDLGNSCGDSYVDIQTIALPGSRSTYVNNFGAVANAVAQRVNQAAGGPRNYLIIADTLSGGGIFGQGQLYEGSSDSERPDAGNIHNNGGLFSIIWYPDTAAPAASVNGWQPTILLHEMSHNFGAVQWSAPHSSQPAGGTNYTYSHCWDGYDVMCYQDGPNMSHPYVTTSCSSIGGAMWQTYDCGQDDYFNPQPAGGTYLATHWDVYNNVFMGNCSALVAGSCGASVALDPPTNTAAPTVSGTPRQGQTLTSSGGSWTPAGASLSYRWQRDTGSGYTDITGATSNTYTLTGADVGASVRAHVTAANGAGAGSADSSAVGPVASGSPTSTVAPALSGTAARGSVLTVSTGTWDAAVTTYAYKWQRNAGAGWVDITGQTAKTYTLTKTDESAVVRAIVTASNGYGGTSAASAASDTVAPAPPANTVAPVLTGTAQRTLALSTNSGTWSGVGNTLSYQWQRNTGSGWVAITGATAMTYTLSSADTGAVVRALVTATNVDGVAAQPTGQSATVLPSPPLNTVLPALTGAPRLGEKLTATSGTWTPAGATFAYQWQRATVGGAYADITGATATTYTLAAADVGMLVRVQVTATNVDGALAKQSTPVGPIGRPPINLVAPAAPSGTLLDTATLSADKGTWDAAVPDQTGTWNDTTPTYTYQWLRCPSGAVDATTGCTGVATTATYALTGADVDHPMAVRITATTSGGAASAVSALTDPVVGRPLTIVTAPAISGTATIPQQLKATTGTWSVPTSSTRVDWLRCNTDGSGCVPISAGQGTASYTLTGDDRTHAVKVRVTAVSPGRTETADSALVPVADQPLPVATVAPTVSGSPVRMSTLAAKSGTWTNASTLAYRWVRCASDGTSCAPITGATGTAYVLEAADVGHVVTVQVTATNSTGTATAQAASPGVVKAAGATNTVAPSIGGTAQEGRWLVANRGTWTATGDTRYAYQWNRCAADGTNCQAIAGAAGSQYKPVGDDVGGKLTLTVTATNADGPVSATSGATAVVAPAPPALLTRPTLTGASATIGQAVSMTPGTYGGQVTTVTTQLMRCASACVAVGSPGATSYTIAAGDAGALLRLKETATGPGGTVTTWAYGYVGPVKSSTSGSAVLTAGSATLTTSAGIPLATATITRAAAVRAASVAPGRTVTVRRAAGVGGALRVWACTVPPRSGKAAVCTKARPFAALARLRVPATGHVAVVVKRGR